MDWSKTDRRGSSSQLQPNSTSLNLTQPRLKNTQRRLGFLSNFSLNNKWFRNHFWKWLGDIYSKTLRLSQNLKTIFPPKTSKEPRMFKRGWTWPNSSPFEGQMLRVKIWAHYQTSPFSPRGQVPRGSSSAMTSGPLLQRHVAPDCDEYKGAKKWKLY